MMVVVNNIYKEYVTIRTYEFADVFPPQEMLRRNPTIQKASEIISLCLQKYKSDAKIPLNILIIIPELIRQKARKDIPLFLDIKRA